MNWKFISNHNWLTPETNQISFHHIFFSVDCIYGNAIVLFPTSTCRISFTIPQMILSFVNFPPIGFYILVFGSSFPFCIYGYGSSSVMVFYS